MASLPKIERPALADHFDVAVIGGGINGAAIARECARAGRRTLLLEQHDFCSGTTSRSTRIIHGGLRYLEHGEVGLVREALRERERLLAERPHLVRPLQFVLALRPGGLRSTPFVRTGLWLYRRMGTNLARLQPAEELAASRRQLEQMLDSGRRLNVFSYEDAQCEFPERLVAEWLREAIAAGCVARNYARVLALECRDGRVRALRVRDELSGVETRIEAAQIVNAAGPWVDRVLAGSVTTPPLVGGVRGSHIVLPKFAGAPTSALYAEAPDGRPMFVLPWNDQMLVGTTEVADSGDPGAAAPSPHEIQYLLACVHQLFPRLAVNTSDVRYSFAGVRPLPYAPGVRAGTITRRHLLHEHTDAGAAGLISVVGGKLTTAASLARECAGRLGIDVPEPERAPLPVSGDELDASLRRWSNEVAARAQVSAETADAITEWFGPAAVAVAQIARGSKEANRQLCPHTAHVVAEAVYAAEQECAVTLADLLLRRVPVALGPCWSAECTHTAAARVGAALRWNEAHVAAETANFAAEREHFLRRVVLPQAAEGAN